MQKHYLADQAAFEAISDEWPKGTPEPPGFPCIAVWTWFQGITRDWVEVEYILEDDFMQNKKAPAGGPGL